MVDKLAGVPTNFQAISNVLANYNFVDIASGTGYISFYAGNTIDLKILSNNTYYSQTLVNTATTTNSGTYVMVADVDFDTLLNRPLDLKGLGIVNVPTAGHRIAGAATYGYWYVRVYVRKWDGVTETDIVTNDGQEHHDSSALVYRMEAIDVNVTTSTHLKVGETLRLTVQLWAKQDDAGANLVETFFASDPKNRTTGWDTTGAVPSQLTFYCPVRLNL